MVHINSLERDGLRQAELCPRNTMMMTDCLQISIYESSQAGCKCVGEGMGPTADNIAAVQ